MASKAKKQVEPDQNTPEAAEASSLDAAQQTIKTLMKLGKERGFVTHDELNAALPAEEYTSEQIDDVMSSLSEMGVSVVDSAESDRTTMKGMLKMVGPPATCLIAMYPARMIQCGCICVRWVVLNCCLARVRLPLPNVLRLAAK